MSAAIAAPAWEATPAHAGGPREIDVSGVELDFDNEVSGGPGLYYPYLYQVDSDCVSAYVSWTAVSNVDEENTSIDGNESSSFGAYIIGADLGPVDPNDREPALSEVKVDFWIRFALNVGCDSDESNDDDVNLTGVCLYVADIDDRQFTTFGGSPTYNVLDGPLTVTEDGEYVTVAETAGVESDDDQQEHWAQFSYDLVSQIRFSLGILVDGDGYAGFDVVFQCAPWSSGSPVRGIDWDYYLQRGQQAEGALPNTK